MKTTLNLAEQRLARFVASRRRLFNRSRGIQNQKQSSFSDDSIDLQGIAGEIAFCKLFNVYPSLQTESATYPEYDCSAGGQRIDPDIPSRPFPCHHLG